MGLFDAFALNTNLIFLHRGVIPPKGGIGHHYHNQMEEMFVIFDNEAAVHHRRPHLAPRRPGRRALPHGPLACASTIRPTSPTEWMNIAVGSVKGKYDAFDIGDDRVGATVEPKPVFVTMRLDRKLLRPVEAMNGGKGVAQYRRALQPEVFFTNWAYVDHAGCFRRAHPSDAIGIREWRSFTT